MTQDKIIDHAMEVEVSTGLLISNP